MFSCNSCGSGSINVSCSAWLVRSLFSGLACTVPFNLWVSSGFIKACFLSQVGVICWWSKKGKMLHQSLHLFLLVWPVNVACWTDTVQKPAHLVLISICDRKYARVPICLFTHRHFHIKPVFPENFPNRIWVSVGFIIRLDPQSRYFPACCYTVALPSCGLLKKCICEGIRVC